MDKSANDVMREAIALDATATSDGSRAIFEAYEEDKLRRLGAEADRPHRMTYRKLTR